MTTAVARADPDAAHGGDRQRLADLMTTLQGNLLSIGVGNAVIATGMAAALLGSVSTAVLTAWLVLQLLHSAFNVWAWQRLRGRPTRARHAVQRARASEAASLVSGLLWAAPLPWLWPAERLELQLLIFTLLTGLTSGAIHSLSAHVRAFRLFMAPIVAMVFGLCVWSGGMLHLVIAAASVVYGFTSLRFAAAMHDVQLRSLRQRDELATLAADLQVQKELAEQANRGKSRFLAAASHDIRQPVHALGLFLGAFDDQALTGRNAALIGPLRASAQGLREMLDGVLDLSRAEAGALQAVLEPLPLQRVLDVLERDFAPLAEARGLVLRTVPTREWATADEALLLRVARNLVGNAVRYTLRGGVLMGVRRRGATRRLEIWDTGPGIGEAERARLFEEFVRGPQASTVDQQGLGLGLAIARRFALALQAPLAFQSRPGRGTVFTLSLQAALAPQHDPVARDGAGAQGFRQADQAPHGPPLGGLRVLLLDDDVAVREATTLVLRDWGCEVHASGDPAASPDRLPGFDVVLSDNQFAGLARAHEVADALQALRARGEPAPRLVVLTGDVTATNLAALRAGAVPVLAKPLEPHVLRRVLAQAMPLDR